MGISLSEVYMREFTTSALVARPSEVLEAASNGGALLTRHGHRKFVIISTLEYQLLKRARALLASEPANEGSPAMPDPVAG